VECGELRDYMSSIIKRTVASKLKSTIMYFVTLALVLLGVSFAAPKFFGQVAHAVGYTQTDFKAFDGVAIGTDSYTVSKDITATYMGSNTIKLTGYAPIVTPWFNHAWTTYNYVTIGINLPTGFTGTSVYDAGVMRYNVDPSGIYAMGTGSTPLATDGAAKGYLDYSFAANSINTTKDGLVKLKVIWTAGGTPEYFTIDISNLSLTLPLPDTTPPVITLTGSSSMLLNNGESYVEPGATINEGTLVRTGSVNTSVAGVYTITYTVTDAAGNVSIAYRTVTVKAADKPVVSATTLGGGQVLGDEVAVAVTDTTKEPETKGEVKGTSDVKKEDAPWYDAAFMGLAWYWWVVLAIAAGGLGWWAFGAIRNRNQN